jgi:hypothetical protein
MVFPAEVAFNSEDEPLHIVAAVADTEVGAEGKAETINSPEKALLTADPQPPRTEQ